MSMRLSSNPTGRSRRARRRGVTVLEVLFAMGIALMGLAGIASLLLLGGRQASDSNQAAEAQALAQDWYGEFSARGLDNSSKWAWYKDFTPNVGMRWFDKEQGIYDSSQSNRVPTKGPGKTYLREFGRESVCLDPMFYAGRDLNNVLTPSGWYRPSVFPYYDDQYNPTVDPATPPSSGLQWSDQPRMLRVTWAFPGTTGNPSAISSRVLEQIFFSQDDLSVVVENSDKSVAPARGISFYDTSMGPPLPLGRYAAESQYSWLATLSPTDPFGSQTETTDMYRLSLVVMKKRDRMIFDPAASTATQRSSGSPATPSNNPQGERLAWVYPVSGNFVGGSGGRVRLISSDGADAKVHVGDWMMLAKYWNFTYSPIGAGMPDYRPSSVFRWFRVVAVEDEETYGSLSDVGVSADPYGLTPPNQVWAQDVVLEGPDWNFGSPVTAQGPSGPVSFVTPTTATILTGATTVYERIVTVP